MLARRIEAILDITACVPIICMQKLHLPRAFSPAPELRKGLHWQRLLKSSGIESPHCRS
ncbi:MAG: hypothetical protein R3D03_07805 [Geminicoccaceae bacterium]